ncbi:EI24 domain-containing protein [Roseospira visakhapatnamensis]|uniref:Uncharacterized protein involved in cysteine biosynthesis n=1 Tax=Roseospira visakhapatnamensis TaxID=390880 RepID=A0A7W6W914_9PROT|nr:EI24 domain-containing protein [Roseospira visakhapatnamensis]MBB4265383.1 uncharacterized protein involved in cysteine biosynthesis [Roseospira visakhapatnamensis]
MLITAFAKAVAQVSDPRVRRPLMLSLGLTAGCYVALVIALWVGLGSVEVIQPAWLDTVIDIASGLGAIIVALIFVPVVVTAFVGLFLEQVADAVEARHYPTLPPPRDVPMTESILGAASFAGTALLLNLAALPLYILMPAANVVLFLLLNGYLLGREYQEMVAARRQTSAEMRADRRRHRKTLTLAGMAIAGMMVVPVVNLLAPLVATAFMVHVVQALRAEPSSA